MPPMIAPPHAAAFGRADDYDAHAGVQRAVAQWLADRLPQAQRVLEIGCGTGFLRAAAHDHPGDWLMTDIAPAMLARARQRFPEGRFATLDAEHPLLDEPPFDLIAGSLAVQWFGDLAVGLGRLFALLAPGGRLMVTTLAVGSFAEWRAAHAGEAEPGTPAYPVIEALASMAIDDISPAIETRILQDHFTDAHAFLRALKAIGAGTPRPGHRPLGPAALRRVLARYAAQGNVTTYEVALLDYRKPETA